MEKATKALEEKLKAIPAHDKASVAISTRSMHDLSGLEQDISSMGIRLADENKQYALGMVFTQLTKAQVAEISAKPYVKEIFYLKEHKHEGRKRYNIY